MADYTSYIRIKALAPGVTRTLESIGRSAGGVSRSLGKVGVGTQLAGFRHSAAVAYPVQRGMRGIIDTAYDLSEAQNQLSATTLASSDDLKRIADQGERLARTNKFSSVEMIQSANNLAMSGLNVNQILGAQAGVAELATIAQLSLAEAADKSTNAMIGFKLPRDTISEVEASLGRVNDVTAYMASKANSTVSQAFEAYKNAAPLAAALKIPIETTAALVGVLGNAGFQGGEAGTALKSSLARLVAPTKAAREAMALLNLDMGKYLKINGKLSGSELMGQLDAAGYLNGKGSAGLTKWIDATLNDADKTISERTGAIMSKLGDMLNLGPDGADALSESLANYIGSKSEALDIVGILSELGDKSITAGVANDLFGKHHLGKMLTLTQNYKDVRELQAAIYGESAGSAALKAQKMMAGFYGAVEFMKTAFMNLKIAVINSGLGDSMSALALRLRDWFEGLSKVNPAVLRASLIATLLAAALGPVLIYFGFLIQSVGAIIGLISKFGFILKGAVMLIGMFSAGLASVPFVAFIGLIYGVSKATKEMLGENSTHIFHFLGGLKGMAIQGAEWLTYMISGQADKQRIARGLFMSHLNRMMIHAKIILETAGRAFVDLVFGAESAGRATNALSRIGTNLGKTWVNLKALLSGFWEGLGFDMGASSMERRVRGVRGALAGFVEWLASITSSDLSAEAFRKFGEDFAAGLRAVLIPAAKAARVVVDGLVSGLQFLIDAFNRVAKFFGGKGIGDMDIAKKLGGIAGVAILWKVVKVLWAIFNPIKKIKLAYAAVKAVLGLFKNPKFLTAFAGAIGLLSDKFTFLLDKMKEFLGLAGSAAPKIDPVVALQKDIVETVKKNPSALNPHQGPRKGAKVSSDQALMDYLNPQHNTAGSQLSAGFAAKPFDHNMGTDAASGMAGVSQLFDKMMDFFSNEGVKAEVKGKTDVNIKISGNTAGVTASAVSAGDVRASLNVGTSDM